jgi:hypothetical protein
MSHSKPRRDRLGIRLVFLKASTGGRCCAALSHDERLQTCRPDVDAAVQLAAE